ncbi:MAG: hypothetical protein MUF54_09510 [Polyangiaceae bacterium]|jgi:hypothetical protein|nr:hypothetical protein [Polyangiaceae bacterium]
MRLTTRFHALACPGVLAGFGLAAAACLVSIDERLIDESNDKSPSDASSGADASAQPEGGDVSAADTDGTDAPSDAKQQADALVDADADTSEADATEPDSEAADPFDGPLADCYDDSWCPPTGCTLRRCDQGTCVTAGTLKEDAATFDLPSQLACSHRHDQSCFVAARNYLVALTLKGLVVFNTRNPYAIKQEPIPSNIGEGYAYLVRSGERIWAIRNSSADRTDVAWLEPPLDNRSPLPPPTTASLWMSPVQACFAATNDALLLYRYDAHGPAAYVARYVPGLLTTLPQYVANGAVESDAVASSGGRILLHQRVEQTPDPTYRHHFSLQTNVVSELSSNSGSYEEATLTNNSNTYGYFASSRAGAVAWVIAISKNTGSWSNVRASWLVADADAPIEPASVMLETFTTQPATAPQGPVAFIDNETIGTAVIQGGDSPTPRLDIVRRQGANPPQLVKRIPTPPLDPGALSVAGDGGYAYLAAGTTVRMFAPSCAP